MASKSVPETSFAAIGIERAFGQPLEWRQDFDLGKWSISRPFTGFDANDKSDWPRQHKMLADHIVRLYRAVKPVVERPG